MELLIVLMIAAIIAGIGTPSFDEFRRNARLTAAANTLLASLQRARTEAIKGRQIVSICPADPTEHEPLCRGEPFSGWLVFADSDGDCRRDPGEEIIQAGEPLDPALLSEANGRCVSFAPSGFSRPVEAFPSATRFLFCDPRWGTRASPASPAHSSARGVVLSPTGRAQVTRDLSAIGDWEITCG